LTDANGKTVARGAAEAQVENWMTESFVPFKLGLSFNNNPPQSDDGYLILKKANAEGSPQNDDELKIPVRFK
jgi:hypothetical protein